MKNLVRGSQIFIDGNALMYRYFHGRPVEVNEHGQEIHAVKAFIALIWKLLQVVKPKRMVVALDAKDATFRHALFPAYKANRETMPVSLSEQFRPTFLALKFMGIPTIVKPGVEADDVLASLCKRFNAPSTLSYVLTLDKDLMQLVDAQTHWLHAGNFEVLDADKVEEKLGVKPAFIADLLALMGDSVDNIPGAAGIGPKTAAELIKRYGSLDGLLKNKHWIKGKVGKALRDHCGQIDLNRQLTKTRTDVDLPEIEFQPQQKQNLEKLCLHYQLMDALNA